MLGQNWQQLAGFPGTGRDDGSAFQIGNSAYCGLGNAFGLGPSADFYKFDLLSDTWSGVSVAALPALGRQYCCSFSYGQYGYIATGVDANWNATNQLWRYDTLTNAWQQKTNMPDSVQGAICFLINNKAYVCGGRNQANQCTKKVWEYDVQNDSWLQKNNMPDGGRWRASAAVVNGKGYLVFGADTAGKFSDKLFEYDAGNDLWSLIDSFPGVGRTYAAAAAINNFLVIAVGVDSTNVVHNDCYLYDVMGHQWINQNSLPSSGRKGCMAFSFNNSLYLVAGIDGQSIRLKETWKAANITAIRSLAAGEQKFNIYPNPAKSVVYAELDKYWEKGAIKIFDSRGSEIALPLSENMGGGRISIDVGSLSNGVYWIEFCSWEKTERRKLVICK